MKHTPGPWVCHSGAVYQDGPNVFPKGHEDGSRIALMDRNNPLTMPTERYANARLIAAAPELLAVLTRAADNLALAHDAGCSDQRGLSVDLCTCPLATNWRSARAAIAKAEGR